MASDKPPNLNPSPEMRGTPTANNPEEAYFQKVNQELIQQNRERLDRERRDKEAHEAKERHWMKCPKCGSDMAEIDMKGIKVDHCGSCKGIFFDNGELDLLMQAKEPQGFLQALRKVMF